MSAPHQYLLTQNGDRQVILVLLPGRPLTADDNHPNFEAILEAAKSGDPDVASLFDLAEAAAERFRPLGERVTVANGRIYLDGDEVDNALTQQVRRFLDAGVEDWKPLVRFFERVQAHPNPGSVEQLYSWLSVRQGVTLTPDGKLVAYKGVASDGNGGYTSVHSGTALVNGETKRGKIPNGVGDVVTMPRSGVTYDPHVACSTGLHVGTFEYANSWAQGAMLRVTVDPADVVSVPGDGGGEKIRVCKYRVEEVIDAPETAPVLRDDVDYDSEDDPLDTPVEFRPGDEVEYQGKTWTVDYINSDGTIDLDELHGDEDEERDFVEYIDPSEVRRA